MYKPIKKPRWFKFGDADMTQGGGFYSLEEWKNGFVEIIRVTPCADAGGPSNQFWIELGSVYTERSKEEIQRALCCCGLDDKEVWKQYTRAERRHLIVEAILAYYGMESPSRWTVQIGAKVDPFWNDRGGFDPINNIDEVLRGNCSLEKYVYEKRNS